MKSYSRKAVLLLIDAAVVNICLYLSLLIRFEGIIPIEFYNIFLHSFIILTLIKLVIFKMFGLYTSLWRYASIDELVQIFFAVFSAALAEYLFGLIFSMR